VLGASVLHRWQSVFPQAKTRRVEDASHFVPEDAPERLVAWIETFLATHPCRVCAIWSCPVAQEIQLALWRKKEYNKQHGKVRREAAAGHEGEERSWRSGVSVLTSRR